MSLKTREKMSQRKKELWSDDEFRRKWYAKRWGGDRYRSSALDSLTTLSAEQRKSLATLTEREIKLAVEIEEMRLSRKGKARERGAVNANDPNGVSLLKRDNEKYWSDRSASPQMVGKFSNTTINLSDRRRRYHRKSRSTQQRTKAKLRRIDLTNNSPSVVYSRNQSAHRAIERIELDLLRGYPPFPHDVEEVMSAQRLRNRKVVFQRVLMEIFRLVGRVQLVGSDEEKFLTNCTTRELGELILMHCERGGPKSS